MYQVWLKFLDIYSSHRPETKILACPEQITPSKFDEICSLAIPNQIFTVSMHIPRLVEIHWCLPKLLTANEIRRTGTLTSYVKPICPATIVWRGIRIGYSFSPNLTEYISNLHNCLTLSLHQAIIIGVCKQHRSRWDGSSEPTLSDIHSFNFTYKRLSQRYLSEIWRRKRKHLQSGTLHNI